MLRRRIQAAAVAAVVAIVTGCSAGPQVAPSATTDANRVDQLAQVLARGTLVLSTDLAYPPQSFAVDGAKRATGTRCQPNQLTAAEVGGFDAETGKLAAKALGVEPCFVTPTWAEITAGGWGGRWDVAWGSGAINSDRMARLYMTQPYYLTPDLFYVRADSPIQHASELSGMRIGVCAGCTHELYLQGKLTIPGGTVTKLVDDPKIVDYATEVPGLKDVGDGKLPAFMCSDNVAQEAIKEGVPLRALPDVAFKAFSVGFVDRDPRLDPVAFLDRINAIIRQLHSDGTLRAMSLKTYGIDYTPEAASFDLAVIGQKVP